MWVFKITCPTVQHTIILFLVWISIFSFELMTTPVNAQDRRLVKRENPDLKETLGLLDWRAKPTMASWWRVRDDNIFKPDMNNVNNGEERLTKSPRLHPIFPSANLAFRVYFIFSGQTCLSYRRVSFVQHFMLLWDEINKLNHNFCKLWLCWIYYVLQL